MSAGTGLARKLLEIAKQLGFEYVGIDGNGHHSLRHTNGQSYRIAATPSEYRGDKNAIADMERISGQKLPRAKQRRSRKPDAVSGFDLAAAAREARQREQAERIASIQRAAVAAEERRRVAALTARDRERSQIDALMREVPGMRRR